MELTRDKCLLYLEPIWRAKGWNIDQLRNRPMYILRGMYMSYSKDPKKVQEIINSHKKPKYEQLKMSI